MRPISLKQVIYGLKTAENPNFIVLMPVQSRYHEAGLCCRRKNMKPSDALQANRAAVREIVQIFKATNPRVFGSVLRGEDCDGSDLDLLVDPLPGATLFDLGGLQIELEEMLGVPVDLSTPGDLPPKFRKEVLSEAMSI